MGGAEDLLTALLAVYRSASAAFLVRVGLDRRELRAWAMYDWANSPFQSTIVNAIFPIFYASFAAAGLPGAEATARYAWGTTVAVVIVAVLGPVLGAVADYRAWKKRLFAVFLAVGILAVLAMGAIREGAWLVALVIFIVANIGDRVSWVFYDSLLPHIASPSEIDRVSTAGYAIGYFGGGVVLLLNLAWILSPATFGIPDAATATKLSFVSVAVWWLLFSLPLFRHVPEPPAALEADETSRENPLRAAMVRVWETFHELRGYRHAFLMLVAFLLYNDGIQTMIRMSVIYATEVGIDTNAQIAALVIVQFVGVPFSFLFGAAADRIGAKTAIFISVAVYTIASMFGYFLSATWQFFALAFLVGTVQGGSQALSRSLFARMIPKHKSSEYFGFFSVFEKFAGIAGPAVFAISVTLFGNSRAAVLSIILFFILGAIVLSRVDVAEGERQAAAAAAKLA
jgi:UMF1 family MFS transporter